MSEPTPPQPDSQTEHQIQLHFNAHPTPGPDGKMWVGIVFASGPVIAEVRIQDEMADAVAEAIPGIIRDAAANARRANLGLIIPGNGNMTKIDLSKMRDPGGSGRG